MKTLKKIGDETDYCFPLVCKNTDKNDTLGKGFYLITNIEIMDDGSNKIRINGYYNGKNIPANTFSSSESWILVKQNCKLPLDVLRIINGKFNDDEDFIIDILEKLHKDYNIDNKDVDF